MRVIIAGSRNATRLDVWRALELCPWSGFISVVISGTARGADSEGERWAEEHNVKIQKFPANWKKEGKRAGPVRNLEMAKNADGLVAVWDGQSRGTHNMIDKAIELGLRVFILRSDLNKMEEFQAKGDIYAAWEQAEERAGILEHDGGMDRSDAERIAGVQQTQ